ncbi:amino acid ABC transporter permease [Pseudomonas turukhanskensis]|uniref:ABC transporter permease n=1 Tax=Pseudomonas turukhanskensis TaxID=1806536 RepID=A0A9W6KA31_9PSED|nr:amino acid ABC transporter permease [Pseudomonas turukhanskensis]GLK90918.1 ABC transporter permease [Pseudomonas turukhanskensis]
MFDLSVVLDYRSELLNGLWMTAWISALAILLGFVIGVLACIARVSGYPVLRAVAAFYISTLRGTPLLVQLSMIFFMLPLIGISLPPLLAAIIALALNSGASQAEILRGGFETLPCGQTEAGWDIGLDRWQILRHVQLPQVVRATIPALVNETIDIIKNSSLVSTIAVTELMRIAHTYSSTTYRPLEFFTAAGLLYLTLTLSAGYIGKYLEKRLSTR